jgi:hypothetical protein
MRQHEELTRHLGDAQRSSANQNARTSRSSPISLLNIFRHETAEEAAQFDEPHQFDGKG